MNYLSLIQLSSVILNIIKKIIFFLLRTELNWMVPIKTKSVSYRPVQWFPICVRKIGVFKNKSVLQTEKINIGVSYPHHQGNPLQIVKQIYGQARKLLTKCPSGTHVVVLVSVLRRVQGHYALYIGCMYVNFSNTPTTKIDFVCPSVFCKSM